MNIMKNTLFSILCFCISFASIKCNRNLNKTSDSNSFPTATKYASILYAKQATEKVGTITTYADHFVIKGNGKLKWQVNIAEGGEYEVVLDYSARKEGVTIKVGSDKNTISNSLSVTQGVYIENKDWYQFNCERKLLSNKLSLNTGLNSIDLNLDAPNMDFETIIYALELIPVKKMALVTKEITQAHKARPQMNWFAAMKYGVMFHWTSLTTPLSGPLKPYKEAVKDFDVNAFVNMVEKTGADYVIFTGCWAEPYIPAPLKQWEKEYPGHTTDRDLISEISEGLKKRNIRLILYLSTHVYAQNDKVDNNEFDRLNNELISEIGERYKDKIDGYWFDGWYQSYQKHPSFNFEKFYNSCKIGNPKRIIALNSWLYPIVSEWQDYWAGEVYTPGVIPKDHIIKNGPGKGLQFHTLLALEDDWAHTALNTKIKSPRLQTDSLINYIAACQGKGPVTINIEIYQDGSIDEAALAEMEKIKQRFKK